jgi:hypothetical protein
MTPVCAGHGPRFAKAHLVSAAVPYALMKGDAMSDVYERLVLRALHREQLSGEVEIEVSTLVAIRLQQTYPAQPKVRADDVQFRISTNRDLTVRWRHDPELPAGTVSWVTEQGRKTIPVAMLLM